MLGQLHHMVTHLVDFLIGSRNLKAAGLSSVELVAFESSDCFTSGTWILCTPSVRCPITGIKRSHRRTRHHSRMELASSLPPLPFKMSANSVSVF